MPPGNAARNTLRGHAQVTLSQTELLVLVSTATESAVTNALEIQRNTADAAAQDAATQLAADAVPQENYTHKLKRVKVWAVAIVAVISGTVTAAAAVYARGQQAQEDEAHEKMQDTRLDNAAASFVAHEAAEAQRSGSNATKIRNLGALQIEQGNDQRAILIDSAPARVAKKRKTKPDTLLAAEAAVLRD